MLIPFDQLPAHTRVWVYQAPQALPASSQEEILQRIERFINTWDSHGKPLKGSATILHNHFLIIGVDEGFNQASGCSIDKSVHFLKELGEELQLDFFDRTRVAFLTEGRIQLEPISNIKPKIGAGEIQRHTLVFNNLVSTVEQLQQEWQIPAERSWVGRYFRQN